MPDLGTHIALGYWARRFPLGRSISDRVLIPVFMFGSLLPDLVSKISEIVFSFDYYWFFNSFHTPFSLLFQCIAISLLFEAGIRKAIFLNLAGGTASHLFLDSLQWHITGGNYFWLFPFSDWTGEIGILDVADWPYMLAASLTLVVLSHLYLKVINHSK